MVSKIIWSEEAYATFNQNIEYLNNNWSEKEISKFTQALNKIIERIKKYPESFPASSKNHLVRKARINKQITLYYRFNKTTNEIGLITFWHNKKDPNKSKY